MYIREPKQNMVDKMQEELSLLADQLPSLEQAAIKAKEKLREYKDLSWFDKFFSKVDEIDFGLRLVEADRQYWKAKTRYEDLSKKKGKLEGSPENYVFIELEE